MFDYGVDEGREKAPNVERKKNILYHTINVCIVIFDLFDRVFIYVWCTWATQTPGTFVEWNVFVTTVDEGGKEKKKHVFLDVTIYPRQSRYCYIILFFFSGADTIKMEKKKEKLNVSNVIT